MAQSLRTADLPGCLPLLYGAVWAAVYGSCAQLRGSGGPGPKTAGWAGARLACTAVLARGVVRAEEKQMVVVYLSPHGAGAGGAGMSKPCPGPDGAVGGPLAGVRYTMAPYDQIQAGFRNAIMGIELRR